MFWNKRITLFVMVGAIGFAVDGGILSLLYHGADLDPYVSRMVSFSCAVTATWALNRRITFRDRCAMDGGRRGEYGCYLVTQIIGASANLAIYAVILHTVPALATWPIIALAFGAVAGLIVNYTLSLLFVFKK